MPFLYFGLASSFTAEVKALWFGMHLCKNQRFAHIHIQLDSKMLVDIRSNDTGFPWTVTRDIQELKSFHFNSVSHCYREANRITDGLANLGVSFHCHNVFFNFRDLPKDILGEFRMDKLGIFSLRRTSFFL